MRSIEEIKLDIREVENELYSTKISFSEYQQAIVDTTYYQDVQEQISLLESEINNDIIYIKTVYNQLLSIRANAELLVRQNNDIQAIETSDKVHQAFLMLVEYNKKLNEKISTQRKLIEERESYINNTIDKSIADEYEKQKKFLVGKLKALKQELQEAESKSSTSTEIKNKTLGKYLDYEYKKKYLDNEIKIHEAQRTAIAGKTPKCYCGSDMVLRFKQKVFWGCPRWMESGSHKTLPISGDGELLRKIDLKLKELNEEKKHLSAPTVLLSNEDRLALENTTIDINSIPSILETGYSNYLFQSLCVPSRTNIKDNFDELLRYSRFRIFTKLPKNNTPSERERTIYSLSLRLMNRGVVLNSYRKTEAKIKSLFSTDSSYSHLVNLNDYITYNCPQNRYDSERELDFAKYYFPKVLGESWATYVYFQMPIETLLDSKGKFEEKRVDFFVCYGDKKIVIELDGKEHKKSEDYDGDRDGALKSNGYIVLRYSNDLVDRKSDIILNDLKGLLGCGSKDTLTSIPKKQLVASKVVHQISIAILKMLEEGHISTHSKLNLEISSKLFTAAEKKILLLLATEEVTELVSQFAFLYNVQVDLDFSDEKSEQYWIQIGDGDDNRNSIVIRDIVLPINYLCSIHPFAIELPEKENVTEAVLEYFLYYVYGYAQFRPGQFAAIRRTLRREESIVLLPTGSGKSVIYQLSSMLLPGITVVISPLRSLIEDQVINLAEKGINNVAAIYSTDAKRKEEMLQKTRAIINNHSAMMLYIAPERMQMPNFREEMEVFMQSNNFCLVAIDEAHCVSEWGHEFRAPYLQIGRSCRRMFKKDDFVPPIIALTGTASDNVLRDVKRDLEITNEDAIIAPDSFDRAELHYSILPCKKQDKYECLREQLNKTLPSKFGISLRAFETINGKNTYAGIVFTPLAKKTGSIYAAWNLFNQLNEEMENLQIGTYFSESPNIEKIKQEAWQPIIKSYATEFKDNKKQLLVATKAFGMGIDKPNIRYVIHYGLSTSIEQYYQEVGRAGRNGADAECVMLFSSERDNEAILNPNIEWEEFNEKYKKYQESLDANKESDDVSPLLFFHDNNFKGTNYEKSMLRAVLNYINNSIDAFDVGKEISMSIRSVYCELIVQQTHTDELYEKVTINLITASVNDYLNNIDHEGNDNLKTTFKSVLEEIKRSKNQNMYSIVANCYLKVLEKHNNLVETLWYIVREVFNNEEQKQILGRILLNPTADKEKFYDIVNWYMYDDKPENSIAKAIIRLVTLGIVQDYEFDYSKKQYTIYIGSIEKSSVLNNYLNFVDCSNRGRTEYEHKQLQEVDSDGIEFVLTVIDRYVELVYGTIEKGRRRALHSMYRLAEEASKIKNPDEQNEYIRNEINNYLVKNDTVEIVKNSDTFAGLFDILNAFPLYPNDVIIDKLEMETSKKAASYVKKVLDNNPDHPGLLYLSAITAIKSGSFDENDVRNDIVAALQNAGKYSIPKDVSMNFLVKVLNLLFNSSADLFEFVWSMIDGKYIKEIVGTTLALTKEEISEQFKDYLLLHIKSQMLRKIIGGKN